MFRDALALLTKYWHEKNLSWTSTLAYSLTGNGVIDNNKFNNIDNGGLYFKHIAIINDASRVISEWRHTLEGHSRITLAMADTFIVKANEVDAVIF